jgi:hypothetical protein
MMDNTVFKMRMQQNIQGRCWDLFGWSEDLMTKERFYAEPIVVEKIEDEFFALPAMARLRIEEVQLLMDDLWIAGVRPSKRLIDEVPLDHLKGEVDWNRKIIERLLPVKRR